MSEQSNEGKGASSGHVLYGITDDELVGDLYKELLEPFWSLMDRNYTASVSWDRYDENNPIAAILRTEINDLCAAVKGIVRRHLGKPELGQALGVCVGEVDRYRFEDRPVVTDGVLDRRLSHVRFGYFSQQERAEKPELIEHANQAVYFREDVLKRERLRLAEVIQELMDDRVKTSPKEAIQDKIEWTVSAAAFEHVFSTLAAQGYFKLPTMKGKQGDANLTHFARQLLSLFQVLGEGRKPITAEQLRVRLSPGSGSKLAEAKQKKFQIPTANELVIPVAKELE